MSGGAQAEYLRPAVRTIARLVLHGHSTIVWKISGI